MMKTSVTLLAILSSISSFGQKIEQFYNWNWQRCEAPNAHYYTLIEKKDSLWERKDYFIHEKRLQMEGSYTDTSCKVPQGLFHYYHPNGMLESVGNYSNGKRQGLWLYYHSNGMMSDSIEYVNGMVIGTDMSWHPNGYLKDSAFIKSDGSGVLVSWFDDGSLAQAGLYAAGRKETGKWKFFYRNGNPSSIEIYDNGKLLSRQYYNEDGTEIKDTTNTDRDASFPGGLQAWKKYLEKHTYFPSQWKFDNADQAVVTITGQ